MQQFSFQPNSSARRGPGSAIRRWGFALAFLGIFIGTLILWAHEKRAARWAEWAGILAFEAALISAIIVIFGQAMRRAGRQMVFLLDDNAITRRRKGSPDIRIAFSDVQLLQQKKFWLVIESTATPRRKIVVSPEIVGFKELRAELAKHHALTGPAEKRQIPLTGLIITALSASAWAGTLFLSNSLTALACAAVAAATLLWSSRLLWQFLRRSAIPWLAELAIGSAWLMAVLVVLVRTGLV